MALESAELQPHCTIPNGNQQVLVGLLEPTVPHHALKLQLVCTLQLKWILHDQINQNLRFVVTAIYVSTKTHEQNGNKDG